MCLITEQSKPSVSEKSITCYKILKKKCIYTHHPPCIRYYSLYQKDFQWMPFGMVNTPNSAIDPPYDTKYLGIGWLHTFKTLDEARLVLDAINSHVLPDSVDHNSFYDSYVIVKCEIPEGSKYYEGNSFCEFIGTGSYCSDKLVLIEEVNVY